MQNIRIKRRVNNQPLGDKNVGCDNLLHAGDYPRVVSPSSVEPTALTGKAPRSIICSYDLWGNVNNGRTTTANAD